MANHLNQILQEIYDNFGSLTENPEIFLRPSSEQNANFKNVTKKIYDVIVPANSLTNLQTKALPKLLVQGFDDEQIWQQIELQNPNAISHIDVTSNIDLSSLNLNIGTQNSVDNLQESLALSEDEAIGDQDNEQDSDEDSGEDLDDDDSDEYIDFEKPSPTAKSNEIVSTEASPSKSFKKKYKSPVDDQFFKISKLEQFLRLEDLKEERSFDATKRDDDSSSEEDINLFEDIPSDDEDSAEESDNETTVKKSSKDLMYEDFFRAPESGDESVAKSNEETDEENDNSNVEDDLMDADSEDGTVANNKLPNEVASEKNSRNKTPFQLQLEKTKQQIALFEKGLLEPAPWHLTGEVDASKRPTDALLHLQTDFEVNARPVVIEDKPLCEKLENMLIMTIKNKAYSDGVRQYKTTKEMVAQKKETIIEQNKSTKSLAQEYEDMYLKQKTKTEDEEDPKHTAIKKLRDSLFPELHALFSHIPKPAVPDIKIVSNLPAISAEEVAPTSVSDVTLLAPEEVKKRSGLVKGMTERVDTDKKRERRKKKALQKLKQKKREKESDEKPASGKLTKKDKLEALKKLKQHRNTKIAGATGEKVKSSKDFFAKLQETMDSNTKPVGAKKKSIRRNI